MLTDNEWLQQRFAEAAKREKRGRQPTETQKLALDGYVLRTFKFKAGLMDRFLLVCGDRKPSDIVAELMEGAIVQRSPTGEGVR